MTAAHQWLEARSLAHVKRTNPLGAIKFVSGKRKQIDAELLHVNRYLADGLHGIRVKYGAIFARQLPDLLERLKRSDLVIGEHHADQDGLRPDRPLHICRVDDSARSYRDVRALYAPPLQCPRRVKHRRMLDRRAHNMLGSRARPGPCSFDSAKDSRVATLCAATGKNDLRRMGVDQPDYLIARLLHGLARPLSVPVDRRSIAVVFVQI